MSKNEDLKKDAKKRLHDMMDNIDMAFDANAHMMLPGDIPKSGDAPNGVQMYDPKDYTSIMERITAAAKTTIESIAKNYMLVDINAELTKKTSDAIESQTRTLADVEFMIEECKEMAQTVRSYIDSGDLSQQMFMTHRGYLTDLQSHIQTRVKMLKDFEQYWKNIATEAGIEKSEESSKIATVEKPIEAKQDTKVVMTTDNLLRMMEEAKKAKDEYRKA